MYAVTGTPQTFVDHTWTNVAELHTKNGSINRFRCSCHLWRVNKLESQAVFNDHKYGTHATHFLEYENRGFGLYVFRDKIDRRCEFPATHGIGLSSLCVDWHASGEQGRKR